MAISSEALNGIGSAIGSFVGAIGANASSKKQYRYQSALQSQAAQLNYDYSIKSAKKMPSATRQGLENAGYNPMLAVQNATSGANSSWTSAGQSTAPDYAGAISQGVANAQSFQRLKNETNVAESAEDMNYANADKAKAEANESVLRSEFIPDKEKSIIAKQNAEAKKLENDIHIAEEQIKLGQMGITVQQEANAINAIGKEEYADRAKRYKEWGQKYPWLRNVDESITRYFNGASFGASKKIK